MNYMVSPLLRGAIEARTGRQLRTLENIIASARGQQMSIDPGRAVRGGAVGFNGGRVVSQSQAQARAAAEARASRLAETRRNLDIEQKGIEADVSRAGDIRREIETGSKQIAFQNKLLGRFGITVNPDGSITRPASAPKTLRIEKRIEVIQRLQREQRSDASRFNQFVKSKDLPGRINTFNVKSSVVGGAQLKEQKLELKREGLIVTEAGVMVREPRLVRPVTVERPLIEVTPAGAKRFVRESIVEATRFPEIKEKVLKFKETGSPLELTRLLISGQQAAAFAPAEVGVTAITAPSGFFFGAAAETFVPKFEPFGFELPLLGKREIARAGIVRGAVAGGEFFAFGGIAQFGAIKLKPFKLPKPKALKIDVLKPGRIPAGKGLTLKEIKPGVFGVGKAKPSGLVRKPSGTFGFETKLPEFALKPSGTFGFETKPGALIRKPSGLFGFETKPSTLVRKPSGKIVFGEDVSNFAKLRATSFKEQPFKPEAKKLLPSAPAPKFGKRLGLDRGIRASEVGEITKEGKTFITKTVGKRTFLFEPETGKPAGAIVEEFKIEPIRATRPPPKGIDEPSVTRLRSRLVFFDPIVDETKFFRSSEELNKFLAERKRDLELFSGRGVVTVQKVKPVKPTKIKFVRVTDEKASFDKFVSNLRSGVESPFREFGKGRTLTEQELARSVAGGVQLESFTGEGLIPALRVKLSVRELARFKAETGFLESAAKDAQQIPGSALALGRVAGAKKLEKIKFEAVEDVGLEFVPGVDVVSEAVNFISTPSLRIKVGALPKQVSIEKIIPTIKQLPLEKVVPTIKLLPTTREVSITKSIQKALEFPRLKEITRTGVRTRVALRESRLIRTRTLTEEVTVPRWPPPRLRLDDSMFEFPVPTKRFRKRALGFLPFVRRKGELVQAFPFPVTEAVAEAFGAKKAIETAARSFIVLPTKRPARRVRPPALPKDFLKQFRPAKTPKLRGFLVEKAKFALAQKGEFEEITEKGLRRLALFPELRKSKKKRKGRKKK